MRLLVSLTAAAALLPVLTFAAWFPLPRLPRHNKPPSLTGCEFTLSSGEPFVCPAGQLQDGQIRLNGSYETASFFIANGGITDSDGFGCIVTEAPITQFQCDSGKSPTPGFSVDASNNLLYQGSPSFWACPATDYEYNIYVKPDFGQTKCFPITLKTSGCGAAAPPLPPTSVAPPPTVWETQTKTVTEDVTQTVTVLTTLPPTACPTHWNQSSSSSRGPCKHCTKSTSAPNGTWTHTAVSGRGILSKRALYEDWAWVREQTNSGNRENDLLKWVRTGNINFYGPLVAGMRVGTDYFHGCTVFVIIGSRGLLFGHIIEESAGGCRALETRADTDRVIIPQIENSDALLLHDFDEISPADCPNDRFAIIFGSARDESRDQGPARLKEFFMDPDFAAVPPPNVRYTHYIGSSAGDQVASPIGKALVMVDADGIDPDTQQQRIMVRVFFTDPNTPRLTLRFRSDNGRLVALPEIAVANSRETSDGTKVYTN